MLGRRWSSICYQWFIKGNSHFAGEQQILLMTLLSLKSHVNSSAVLGQAPPAAFGVLFETWSSSLPFSWSAKLSKQSYSVQGPLPSRLSPQGQKDMLSVQLLRSTVPQSSLSQPFAAWWTHGLSFPFLRAVCFTGVCRAGTCADSLPLKQQTGELQRSPSWL